jgi:hypothetical protein
MPGLGASKKFDAGKYWNWLGRHSPRVVRFHPKETMRAALTLALCALGHLAAAQTTSTNTPLPTASPSPSASVSLAPSPTPTRTPYLLNDPSTTPTVYDVVQPDGFCPTVGCQGWGGVFAGPKMYVCTLAALVVAACSPCAVWCVCVGWGEATGSGCALAVGWVGVVANRFVLRP